MFSDFFICYKEIFCLVCVYECFYLSLPTSKKINMELIGIFRIIYFLGAVNALFFSFLIFNKKKKSLADKILGSWLIILSIQLIYPFFYLYDLQNYQKYMGYEASIVCLHPVFLYFYTQAMTNQLKFSKKLLIGIIPMAIFMITTPFMIFQLSEDMLAFTSHFDIWASFNSLAITIMFIAMGLMSFIFFYFLYSGYISLKRYKKEVLQIFSYKDNIDLLWLRRLVVYFSLSYIFVSILGFVFYYANISLIFIDFTFYSSLVIFVFLLAYYGYQQGQIFYVKKEHALHNTINKNNAHVLHNFSNIAKKLEKLMLNEKPYLIPTLTIHELADKLKIPAHQLSKVIHKEFARNFFEYINSFRIEYFKNCIKQKEYKYFTLLGIALECGFNSKSAFNRIFREYTGTTPGEYKKTCTNLIP